MRLRIMLTLGLGLLCGPVLAAQTYPSISPVGAVVTPGKTLHFSVVGLPPGAYIEHGWRYHLNASDSPDFPYPDYGIDYGYNESVGTTIFVPQTDSDGNDTSYEVSLSVPFAISDGDADFNPGTPVPPPPASGGPTGATMVDIPHIDYSFVVHEVLTYARLTLGFVIVFGIVIGVVYAGYSSVSGLLATLAEERAFRRGD